MTGFGFRYSTTRVAAQDEVLPLSKPLVSKSGKTITEIPIPKNTTLVLSAAGYNRCVTPYLSIRHAHWSMHRNTDVFGQDAHLFDPERWLDGRVQTTTSLGVYGNLYETSVIRLKHSDFCGRMTFGSGHRACIGIFSLSHSCIKSKLTARRPGWRFA